VTRAHATSTAAIAAAALLAGCGAFDVEGSAAPEAPSELAVTLATSSFGWPELRAQWTAPAGAAPDVIVLQMRVGDGAWADQFWCDGRETATVLALPSVPDGSRLGFRAVAVDNTVRSTWSNEAAVQVPVAPAQYVMTGSSAGTPYVWWQRTSVGATEVRVDRRLEPPVGEPTAWEQVLLASAATTTAYEDTDAALWRDGTRFAYRVVYLAGDVESAPAEARTPGGRPFPLQASATYTDGAVRVSWTYPGLSPIQVRVVRRPPGTADVELGTVDAPATTFDVDAPVPGFFTYAVRAKNPDAHWYDSSLLSDESTTAVVVPDPALAGVLDASILWMPAARTVARAPSGQFALAWGDGWNTFGLYIPAAVGWERWAPATTGLVRASRPGIHYDAQSRLHAVYEQRGESFEWDVRHRWQDADGWHDEHAGTIVAPGVGSSATALDGGGDPHLLWQDCCRVGTGEYLPLTYAARRDGAWSAEVFGPPLEAASPQSGIAIDPAGEPGLVAQHGDLVLLRRGDGGWTEEVIPTSGTPAAAYRAVLLPAVDRAVVIGRWTGSNGETVVGVRERDASGWRAAEPVLTSPYPWPSYQAAISPDGTRMAIATDSPRRVAIRSGGGWTVHSLAADVEGDFALGFTPGGKLWVLDGVSGWTPWMDGVSVPHVLYEEP
jgi:hypothetical protein